MTLNPELFIRIQHHLIQAVHPYFIIVFGSVVQGRNRVDSDIDIAYLGDSDIEGYPLFVIAQALAADLNCDIDLIDLKKATTVFKAQVIGTGQVIYVADQQKLTDFRIRSLKEYALLNEERAEVMEKFAVRGQANAG